MHPAPIYLEKIEIENIKTFVKKSELTLATTEGKLAQWTLILGDNSIGKSTLLQLIALMKPLVPYDFRDLKSFKFEPAINNEENEFIEKLVHKSIHRKQTATINARFIANQPLNELLGNTDNAITPCTTKTIISVNTKGKLDDIKNSLRTDKKGVFYKDEVLLYAYSASRRLGKQNMDRQDLYDTIPNFIQESTELYDAEEILHQVNYAFLGATGEEQKKYGEFMHKIKTMLVSLMPDFDDIRNIEINSPKLNQHVFERSVLITTKHGKKIPFNDFSLGYKTVTSWTIDLAWRLFSHYANLPNPLEGPAIVLIDELDLHLHPAWQRTIIDNLSKHFPKVQFIASAHSPLMVQAATGSNYAILKFDGEQVTIENNPRDVDGWRVDQILTSEFFQIPSSRGVVYERLTAKREELIKKPRLSKQEKLDLENITLELFNLPTGRNPEEIDSNHFVLQLLNTLKE